MRALVAAAFVLLVAGGAGAEQILRRVPVPSAVRPQGEVRLLRRGGEPIVQVVLWSRVLRRVGREIREKEERNWPDATSAEGAAARRYVAALETAVEETIREAAPSRPRPGGKVSTAPRKLGLAIELSANGAAFLAADVRAGEAGLEIRHARERRRIELPSSYAERNLRLVLADSFGITEENAERWLAAACRSGSSRTRPHPLPEQER